MVLFSCHMTKDTNMKAKLISVGIVIVTMIGITYFYDSNNRKIRESIEKILTENHVDDEQILHDWECKFCIEDGYNGNGKILYHYINEYTRNIDHSITFVGHDGLLWTIPYPYFFIHVNQKNRGFETKQF